MTDTKRNALEKLAGELAMFLDFHKTDDRVNGHVLSKAQRIVEELAKVKLVNGTYGAVAVLSETETDELFCRILTIAEEGAGNDK